MKTPTTPESWAAFLRELADLIEGGKVHPDEHGMYVNIFDTDVTIDGRFWGEIPPE